MMLKYAQADQSSNGCYPLVLGFGYILGEGPGT
jgi:hypothetical protein